MDALRVDTAHQTPPRVILRHVLVELLDRLDAADELAHEEGQESDGYSYLEVAVPDAVELDVSIASGIAQVRIAG
jgi:hypothetical protein